MPAASIAIGTEHVSRVYGRGENAFHALKDVTVAIKQGESVAIVGKSGSGKSTLMHHLALLDHPTSGTIIIDGQDVSTLGQASVESMRNKRFGFVFQQFFLNAGDSVINNVILPLKIAGVGRKERLARGLAALEAVELADKAHATAANLSGGQKQRVCIARAIINNPEIIFADEPTGNLDSQTGKTVEDMLFRLNKQQGITLIIVTHDQDIASRCARQIYIKDGSISKGAVI